MSAVATARTPHNAMSSSTAEPRIKLANREEQAQIKNVLVKIDFRNGNPMHFFHHLTGAMAVDL